MTMVRRTSAEFLGTFWLVFGGCGSAVLAAAFPKVGIGLLGVSLAFGLTVLTMAYAIGHISGCHLNPAVSVGLWAGGRFPARISLPYIVAQVVGAIVAARRAVRHRQRQGGLRVWRERLRRERLRRAFAGRLLAWPPGCSTEVVLTFMFLIVILGATDGRAPAGFAPHRDRARPDADPPDRHPGHQHVGEPGAQHRAGAVRRRLGAAAALAVLARAAARRSSGRLGLQGVGRGASGEARHCR